MNNKPKDKLISKDYLAISLFSAVLFTSINMFFPIMAVYGKLISDSNFVTGLIPGIFTCSSLISIRFSIPVIRRFGKARTLAIGSAITSLSAIIYYFSNNIWLLVLARVVHGLGNGLCINATNVAIADIVPKSRLMEGIGYYSQIQTLTSAVAPAFALSLVENNPSGFGTVFILAFVFSALCFLLSFTITYERKTRSAVPEAQPDSKIGVISRPENSDDAKELAPLKLFMGIETILFLPMFMTFVNAFITQSLGSYLTLSTQERGISDIAFFFSIQAVAIFISRLLVSRVGDKYGAGIILIPSFLVMAFCVYVISIATNAGILNIIAIPYGLASGAAFPTLNGLFYKIGYPGRNTETGAAFSAMGNLSAVCLSVTVALVSSLTGGYAGIYNGMFILPLLGFVAYLLHAVQLRSRTRQRVKAAGE